MKRIKIIWEKCMVLIIGFTFFMNIFIGTNLSSQSLHIDYIPFMVMSLMVSVPLSIGFSIVECEK